MRATKANREIQKIRQEAEQRKREELCKKQGHKWRNEYNTMRYCETCFHLEDYDWGSIGSLMAVENETIVTFGKSDSTCFAE